MRFLLLLLIAVVTFSACKEESREKGEVIDEDKFIDVLVDLHIADAMLATDIKKENEKLFLPKNFYHQVLKKHNITRADFNKSIAYYAEEPAKLGQIYDKVMEKLNTLSAKISGPVEKQKNTPETTQKDSITE